MTPRDVVVVGAGPVGLCLALGLARAGRDVLVLEREAGTAEHSRAPAIWPRTQEALASLGAIDPLLEEGIVLGRLEVRDADREATLLTAPLEELSKETRFPHLLVLPQSRTEALLLDALRREPAAEVRFSSAVTGLVPRDSQVQVRFRDADGDRTVEARFVAGCDGARSVVREALGASFDGETYGMRAALADLRLGEGPPPHSPRLTTRPRLALGIRMADRLWRLILPFGERDDRPLDRRIEDAAAGLFGARAREPTREPGWEPVWRSEFQLHRRLASTFARGRIVLAGDAAHLNSPVGGQGMNAGIQDAERLVAALCAALDGGGSDPLARYGRERRAEIEQGVNRFTDVLTRGLMTGGGRWVRPMLRVADTAMRVPPVRRRILRRMAMLD